MVVILSLAMSVLALLATFHQSYQQRVHNEKSVKPLVQVDLIDHKAMLAVHLRNNGLGPYTITKLEFSKNGRSFDSIEDCLTFDPKTYKFIPITEMTPKIILPQEFLDIFSIQRSPSDTDKNINEIRKQLSVLKIKVIGHDIYDNKIVAERELDWFMKYADA